MFAKLLQLFLIVHYLAPGHVAAVEGHCSVIVWKAPEEPNGKIMNYIIQFLTKTNFITIKTMSVQTFYVIKTKKILPKGKYIFVKVYTYIYTIVWKINAFLITDNLL